MDLKAHIRTIPDFPKSGIQYRDITALLSNPEAFDAAIAQMCAPWAERNVEVIAGLDARGFIFGGAMARSLGAGFVPIRKAGKLPAATHRESYTLEYGEAALEIHQDAIRPGQRVVLVDDLIATGGTAIAGATLLQKLEVKLLGASFLINLPALGGAERLDAVGVTVNALMAF